MLRVGLVGWGASTGNGGMNSDIAQLSPWITSWLCPEHPQLGWHEPYLHPVAHKVIRCKREGDTGIYDKFLDEVNAVLFVEHPYLKGYDLVEECKRRGIFTVCIPMWEWWPERKSWSQNLDMVWCVTKYTRQYLETLSRYLKNRCDRCDWANNIYGDRWGVNIEEFSFKPRKEAKRFLFANGNGGGQGLRKGSAVIAATAALVPNIEILMLTQNNNYASPMPKNVRIKCSNFPSKTEIYEEGDVFLAPTHWEGFGHGLYEAQACGIPVVTTDAAPMNESGADWLIPVTQTEPFILSGKTIPKVIADAEVFSQLLRSLIGSDISEQSKRAHYRIKNFYNLKDVLDDLEKTIIHAISQSSLDKSSLLRESKKVEYVQAFMPTEVSYENLIRQAWAAYQDDKLIEMEKLLQRSLKFTPFLRSETVSDWLSHFNQFAKEASRCFDIQTLTESTEWRRLTKFSLLRNFKNVRKV